MSNLEASYRLILREIRKISENENLYFKPITPKLSDLELISLIILAEFKSIDSEHQLFREIKGFEIESKIERSVYNRRKRRLFPFMVNIMLKLYTEFNYTDETYCLPGSNPTPIITGDHGGIFHIDNNGSINTTNGEISLKDTEPGTYVISYTFASGCSASATDTIEICGDYDLQIPNVFTPNNDHVNDFFQLHFTGVKEISCVIFNRWGNIVFSSDFHQLEFVSELIIWDGLTASNEKATEGVYFYRIEATDFQDNIHNHEGFLTLVK